MPAETVNAHVWAKCNLHCSYCYGQFPARPPWLPASDWCRIIDMLAKEGVKRITFSGGEPTLHPELTAMLGHTREIGLAASLITNGARLTTAMLDRLDMVAVTIDSAREQTLERLGRGKRYLDEIRHVVGLVRDAGKFLKVNTVVTRINVDEDMTDLIRSLRPYKWKPLQFVHVPGENDDSASDLAVDEASFERFVDRHAALDDGSVWFAPEAASTIQTTYVMLDPLGRVFQHSTHGHRVSAPVLEVGIRAALESVGGYDRAAFTARGGDVDIRRLPIVKEGSR
jgi:radical S-adenosyl methionine domain-containing protein 2